MGLCMQALTQDEDEEAFASSDLWVLVAQKNQAAILGIDYRSRRSGVAYNRELHNSLGISGFLNAFEFSFFASSI